MIEIVIDEVAPSLNRLVRLHWAARRRLLEKWKWLVFAEVYRMGGPLAVAPAGRLQVRIVRRSHKSLDHDNLYGSAKIVLDAMRAAKMILDDDPAHIALTCEQEPGKPQTTIQVSPINAPIQAQGSPGEPVVSL